MQQGEIARLLHDIRPPKVSAWEVSAIVANLDQINLRLRVRDMELCTRRVGVIDLTEEVPLEKSPAPPVQILKPVDECSIKVTSSQESHIVSPITALQLPTQSEVAHRSLDAKRRKLAVPPAKLNASTSPSMNISVEVAAYGHPQTITINAAESIDNIWKAHWKRFTQIRDSNTG